MASPSVFGGERLALRKEVRHTPAAVQGPLSLVGRDDELATLEAALEDAKRGRGGLWLLRGDAGIGKSRLADELGRKADGRGFRVVWGRSWETGGAPAFWPWTQAFRGLSRTLGASTLSDLVGDRLLPVLPEIGAGTSRDGVAAPPSTDRLRLLDGVASALCDIATQHPLVVIVDDLHAADISSLMLLDMASRQLPTAPALVLGTFRPHHPRSAEHDTLLARIAQEARTIALGPLSTDAVAAYARSVSGSTIDRMIPALQARSEGNPLFMVELVRLVSRDPAVHRALENAQLPPGLEQALRSHLRAVSPSVVQLLEAAAVIGREFTLSQLASSFAIDSDEALAAASEAVRSGVLQCVGPHAYRFTHVLLRDVVERDCDETRRRGLHETLADHLAASVHGEPAWTEIAHHYEAGGAPCADRAVAALARAAEQALEHLALEDALALYERALSLHEQTGPSNRSRHAELLIGVCRARIQSGDREEGRRVCRSAVRIARELGDAQLLARAALELGSILVFANVDDELVGLLREAADMLPVAEESLRALVLARLAAAMQPAADPKEPIALARNAIELARRTGDDTTLLSVLRTGCSAMVDLAAPDVRWELDKEHARLAAAAGARHDALRAQTRLIFDCFEMGDRLGADAAVRAASALVQDIGHRSVAWRLPAMEAMRYLWDGAFDNALSACQRAAALGESSGDPNARATTVYQRLHVLLAMGRTQELKDGIVELLDLFRDNEPMQRHVRILAASLLLRAGVARDVALRGVDESLVRAGIGFSDRTLLLSIAHVCHALELREVAAELQDELEPEASFLVGGGVMGMTWDAPVLQILGLCARTLGDHQGAAEYERRGIDVARRMGGEPLAIEMQRELDALSAPSEPDRTVPAPPSSSLSASPSSSSRARATSCASAVVDDWVRLRHEGEGWEVQFRGRVHRLADSKGLRYLASLVSRPREDLHVLEISVPEGREGWEGDGGELLDDKARQAYRAKVEELRAELEEAEAWNDRARAESRRTELEQLQAELSRSLGLGGRGRRFTGQAERARVNVQRRLRDAVERMRRQDEELGRHLDHALRTGMCCRYDPP